MTKKDYELIAKGMHRAYAKLASDPNVDWRVRDHLMIRTIINELAAQLKSDNPRFDRSKFVKACLPETEYPR